MKCDFVVGQRVVCVDDDWPEMKIFGEVFPVRVPMINEVLTIVDVQPSSDGGQEVFLYFKEIDKWQSNGLYTATVGFNFRHFRPLQARKTDISVFMTMLTPAGRIPVDA